MSVKLPDIDIDAVTSLEEAKEIISQLLDSLGQQQKELAELRQEVARLKQQPKKPHFSGQQNQSISATKLLEKKRSTGRKQNGGLSKLTSMLRFPKLPPAFVAQLSLKP